MEDWTEQTPDQLRLAARPMYINKGQNLFHFGDEVTAIYRILKGKMSMTRFSPEGSEIVLYRARAGDFFAASITVLLYLQLKKIALGATLVLCFSIGLALTMGASGVLL